MEPEEVYDELREAHGDLRVHRRRVPRPGREEHRARGPEPRGARGRREEEREAQAQERHLLRVVGLHVPRCHCRAVVQHSFVVRDARPKTRPQAPAGPPAQAPPAAAALPPTPTPALTEAPTSAPDPTSPSTPAPPTP